MKLMFLSAFYLQVRIFTAELDLSGYLESEWCVKEFRRAVGHRKKVKTYRGSKLRKMIVVRDYLYHLPETFAPEFKDIEATLKNTLSFAWMAGKHHDLPTTIKE